MNTNILFAIISLLATNQVPTGEVKFDGQFITPIMTNRVVLETYLEIRRIDPPKTWRLLLESEETDEVVIPIVKREAPQPKPVLPIPTPQIRLEPYPPLVWIDGNGNIIDETP